jgi:hypothetical protein
LTVGCAPPELVAIIEEFDRLWRVAGFAEHFAATLAGPRVVDCRADPHDLVLEEHHRLLVSALRRARQRGEIACEADLDDVANALVGCYLSRRLGRVRLDGWARMAIATVLGPSPQKGTGR